VEMMVKRKISVLAVEEYLYIREFLKVGDGEN
jgi:hypothetical protein